jgi:hypothetical protein
LTVSWGWWHELTAVQQIILGLLVVTATSSLAAAVLSLLKWLTDRQLVRISAANLGVSAKLNEDTRARESRIEHKLDEMDRKMDVKTEEIKRSVAPPHPGDEP